MGVSFPEKVSRFHGTLLGSDRHRSIRTSRDVPLNSSTVVGRFQRRVGSFRPRWYRVHRGQTPIQTERQFDGRLDDSRRVEVDNGFSSPFTEDKMHRCLALDVVMPYFVAVVEHLTSKDQLLLIRGYALPVLNGKLDVFNGVMRVDLYGERLSPERFNINRKISVRNVLETLSGGILILDFKKKSTSNSLISRETVSQTSELSSTVPRSGAAGMRASMTTHGIGYKWDAVFSS